MPQQCTVDRNHQDNAYYLAYQKKDRVSVASGKCRDLHLGSLGKFWTHLDTSLKFERFRKHDKECTRNLLGTRNITEALGFGALRRPVAFRLLWHDRRGSCAVQASTSSTLEKKYAKNAKTC